MESSKVKTIEVPRLSSPERLDKYLVRIFPETSRAFWRDNVKNLVKCQNRIPIKSQLLFGGEKLTILNPLDLMASWAIKPSAELPLEILYRDSHILVVNKPAGIPVHPLKPEETITVVHGVAALDPEQNKNFLGQRELGLIHRLDNQTSGVLFFARTPQAKEKFRKLNQNGEILKIYWAWVEGLSCKIGKINDPIAHHPKKKNKMVVAKSFEEAKRWKARTALTSYKLLDQKHTCSLLQISIQKGSRHQIRLHLSSIGHPIVGDQLYGAKCFLKDHPDRFLLHAESIEFIHPFLKEKKKIQAPSPKYFNLETLKLSGIP